MKLILLLLIVVYSKRLKMFPLSGIYVNEGRVIGRGEQGGIVFEAADNECNRLAVKVIKNHHETYNPMDEARVMQLIIKEEVPNIVQLLSYVFNPLEQKHYFVMKRYVGTLEDLITFKKLPEKLVERMAFQLFEAIAGLHAAGVIHRDLHEKNILYDSSYNLFVGDFGLAEIDTTISSKLYFSEVENISDIKEDYENLYKITFTLLTGDELRNYYSYKKEMFEKCFKPLLQNKDYKINWSEVFSDYRSKERKTIQYLYNDLLKNFKSQVCSSRRR